MKIKLKSENKFISINLSTMFKQEKYIWRSLGFLHPITKKEVFFEVKRPTDFDALIKNLEKVSI